MFCNNCGKEIPANDKFCLQCGAKRQNMQERASQNAAQVPSPVQNTGVPQVPSPVQSEGVPQVPLTPQSVPDSAPSPQWPSQIGPAAGEAPSVISQPPKVTPAPFSAPAPFNTPVSFSAPVPIAQPVVAAPIAPPAPAKKSKKGMIWAIVSVGLIAVLCAVLIPIYIKANRQAKYDSALELMKTGEYEQAITEFEELNSFDESEQNILFCQNMIDFDIAKKLMDKGDYADAQKAFAALGSFNRAATLKLECEQALKYEQAKTLLEQADYAGAGLVFEELGTYSDASDQAIFCANTISYAAAEESFAQGLYYTAYLGFGALGEFSGALQRQSECVQPFPATGETIRNEDYSGTSCTLLINPPINDNSATYVKIYAADGTLVSCIAIGKGNTVKVDLPTGSYQIKSAYSYGDWFGETEMFGDDGFYQVLTYDDAGTDTFTLEYNYEYTLSLRSYSGDSGNSVDTYDQNKEDF